MCILFRCVPAHAIGINFHFSNDCRSYIIHIKVSLGNPFVILVPPQKFISVKELRLLVTGLMLRKVTKTVLDGVSIAITMLISNLVFPFQINNDMLDGWLDA